VDVAAAELEDELERAPLLVELESEPLVLELEPVLDVEVEAPALLTPDADAEPPTSTVEKELSRELNTATLALLISVVPSAGRVETG
jgi:hypothetical protein